MNFRAKHSVERPLTASDHLNLKLCHLDPNFTLRDLLTHGPFMNGSIMRACSHVTYASSSSVIVKKIDEGKGI